jgi:iron(III) transport system ATP-binding protein
MKQNMTETADIDRSSGPLLAARDLVRHFPSARGAAVAGVSFEVMPGELIALLGPSGCGKTTTLRLTGGFERPDAGTISLNGRDVTNLPPEKRGIGFVFQDYALFPHLSVAANVAFGLRHASAADQRKRTAQMLEMVGLADLAERMPHQLSGGQQQRVALARTLAPAPPLVLLDEPFSNLDAALRVETRQEVRRLLKQAGSAAILVTHDQEEALALADRIAVMHAGRILQMSTPDDVYRRPADEFVARFIGRSNIVPACANGFLAQTDFGDLAIDRTMYGNVRLAVKPEQFVLTPAEDGNGVVIGREFRGHDQLYWVRVGGTEIMAIAATNSLLTIGTPVRLTTSEPVALFEQAVAENS